MASLSWAVPLSGSPLIPPELADLIASNFWIAGVILILYTIVFIGLSQIARQAYTGEVTDYLVASRSLGWFVTSITILATGFSGVGMAGFPGNTYLLGSAFMVAVLIGFAATAPTMWWLGRRIWTLGKRHNFETPGDLLGQYYGSDLMRVYTVIASVTFNIAYVVAQLLAGGILIHVLTGGVISFQLGLVIMGLIIFLHVTLTGVRGIAYLDTFNGLLVLLILMAFLGLIVSQAGGLSNVFTAIPGEVHDQYISLPGMVGAFTPEIVLIFGIIFTFGTWLMSPAVWIRLYSFEKREDIVKIVSTVLVLLTIGFLGGIYMIASWGMSQYPEIGNPDYISSLLAFDTLPFVLAVLFLTAILAAVISTGDSYIHALSATVTRDFVRAVVTDDLDDRRELQINYVVITFATVTGITVALLYPGLITPLAIFAGGFTVMLLPPLIGAVAWPRASTEAALIAPAAGTMLMLLYQPHVIGLVADPGLIPNPFPVPQVPGLVTGFALNVVLFVFVSFVTKPVSIDRIEEFHGYLHREL